MRASLVIVLMMLLLAGAMALAQQDYAILDRPECSGFRQVYPVDQVPVGLTRYEWTAVDAPIDEYHINFFTYERNWAHSYYVDGSQTSIWLVTGQIPTGSELQWEVVALRDDTIICHTGRTPLLIRLADPNPPPVTPGPTATPQPSVTPSPTMTPTVTPTPVFSAEASCTLSGPNPAISISYSNLPFGDTGANISYDDAGPPPTNNSNNNVLPSALPLVNALSPTSYTAQDIVVQAVPSGTVINLGDRDCSP